MFCGVWAGSAVESKANLLVALQKYPIALSPRESYRLFDGIADAWDTFTDIMFFGCKTGGSVAGCIFDIVPPPVPIAKGAKAVKIGVEVVEHADEAADVVKVVDKATDTAKAADAGKAADRTSETGKTSDKPAETSKSGKAEKPDDGADGGLHTDVGGETGQKTAAIRHGPVPQKAWDAYNYYQRHGNNPPGYWDAGRYANDGRGGMPTLPRRTTSGAPISYTEHDVNEFVSKRARGLQRLLIGSDGSAYYTGTHYQNFTTMIGRK